MNITPLSQAFGAEVDGVDLTNIGDRDFERVYQAWVEYGVLRFRDQALDDPQLEAFSARFGTLEKIPVKLTPELMKRLPSLYVAPISNPPSFRPLRSSGNRSDHSSPRAFTTVSGSQAAWHVRRTRPSSASFTDSDGFRSS